jgi:hypothetical protein
MEKGKFLLITTPRENEILDTLPDLEEQEKLPDNKTEVFRRGLHAVRQLVEVDEKPLLELLVATLEKSKANLNKENIDEVKALAYAVHATLIAKRGIIGAEIFESVPLTCSYLDFIEGGKIDKKEVTKTLEDLAISIKTLILRNSTSTPRSNSKKIRLENKQSVKRLTV